MGKIAIVNEKRKWWKLYCKDEFISYLGYRPTVQNVVNIDELHQCYCITEIEESKHIALATLIYEWKI
jgi:hypothetical protein